MSNPFREAIKGVRIELTRELHVPDLLLGDLCDKDVITQVQHDQILVRCDCVR